MSLSPAAKSASRYVRRVLKALDRLANALLGGLDTQTISARAAIARAAGSRPACIFCRFLDLFERDHCALALESAQRPGA